MRKRGTSQHGRRCVDEEWEGCGGATAAGAGGLKAAACGVVERVGEGGGGAMRGASAGEMGGDPCAVGGEAVSAWYQPVDSTGCSNGVQTVFTQLLCCRSYGV